MYANRSAKAALTATLVDKEDIEAAYHCHGNGPQLLAAAHAENGLTSKEQENLWAMRTWRFRNQPRVTPEEALAALATAWKMLKSCQARRNLRKPPRSLGPQPSA